MKKFLYLCVTLLLSTNLMAQIDPYDRNWDTIVSDDFNETNRQFDSSFQEPLGKWLAFVPSLWPSGVTKDDTHQIYQWNHCIFDGANSVLRLNSQFIRETPILCIDQSYDIPPKIYSLQYHCDSNHNQLYYYSGMIESPPQDTTAKTKNLPPPRFRYGFFEIRCRLPIHEGAFPAFWLWDADPTDPTDTYYEEIDIFEFSWRFEDTIPSHNPHPHGAGNPYCFTTGVYYKHNDTSNTNLYYCSVARNYPMIGDSLSHWHTYTCEWMPEYIKWYCDGNIVNEYHNPDSIPSHHLALKANYAIDHYALQQQDEDWRPVWRGSDNMVIDYINVYQLKWDCDMDETITCQQELDSFDYAVKRSIDISSSSGNVIVRNTDKVTFRVSDSFEITGPFQADSGGEMTVIVQQCPN